jgi:DNA-binding GntR family transcriptional regulator
MIGIRAVDPPTLVHTIADAIRTEIVSGALAPGERIRQEAISAQLGVSRTPLREAFRLLVAEGWLEMKPRVGVRVSPLTVEELQELAVMRLLLEPFAARVAATQHGPADAERAESFLEVGPVSVEYATELDRWQAVESANEDFHFAIYGFTGGLIADSFHLIAEQNWRRFMRYRRFYMGRGPNWQRSRDAHERIFHVWRDRDGEAAEHEVARHILVAVQNMMRSLDSDAQPNARLRSMTTKYGLPND